MAPILSITLAISIVGMISLLLLKRYELNSGRIFLGSARPAVGAFFHRKLMWIEYALPGLMRSGVRALYANLRILAHRAVAWVVVKVEQGLERALHNVRHKTTLAPRRGEETSAFLREVAEHKKKLQEDLPERATVIEE